MEGRTGSRRRPAVIGGQSSRSAKEREERRSPADSGSGGYLERPCSQRAAASTPVPFLGACLLTARPTTTGLDSCAHVGRRRTILNISSHRGIGRHLLQSGHSETALPRKISLA